MSLESELSQIHEAMRSLRGQWSSTASQWRDDGYRRFEQEFMSALESESQSLARGLESALRVIRTEMDRVRQAQNSLR